MFLNMRKSLIYKIETANRKVERDILKLPREDRSRVTEKILKLENEPRPIGAVKLKDSIHRLRVGKMGDI